MHKRRLLLSLAALCSLLNLAILLTMVLKYPLLDLETLDVPVDQFPTQLTATSPHANWQLSDQPFLPGDQLDTGASLVSNSWIDRDDPSGQIVINQLVLNYFLQPVALWQYLWQSQRPTAATPAGSIKVSPLPPGDRFADQEQLLCVDGDGRTCRAWCYWARYRQYVIRLYLSGGQHQLESSTIVPLIERLDQHVQQRVLSGRYR